MPLTDDGYEARRSDQERQTMETEYEERTGLDIDFDFDEFLGNLFPVIADRLGALYEDVQAVVDSRDPNNATGNSLATISQLTGAGRQSSTFGTVLQDLTGTAGTIVPGGSTIYEGGGTADDARWVQRDDVTLDGGGSATGVICDAQDAGAIGAGPGDVDAIVTAVFGLDSVTNPLSATPGTNVQTDPELRVFRAQTLQLGGSAAAAALQAELLTIDLVTAAIVLENATNVPVVIEGVTIDEHNMAPIVHPASIPAATKQEVADAIYRTTCGGINTSGSETAEVIGGDLAPKVVRFSLSTTLTVDVTYDVVRESGVDVPDIATIETELETATTTFFAGLNLAEDVLVIDLVCIAAPIEGVRSVTVTLATDPVDASRIDAEGNVTVFVTELAIEGAVVVNEV